MMDYKQEILDMKKRLLFQEQTLESVQKVVMQLFAGYQTMAKYLDDTARGKPDFSESNDPISIPQTVA